MGGARVSARPVGRVLAYGSEEGSFPAALNRADAVRGEASAPALAALERRARGEFMIGEKLGSFRIDSVLGTGAMGVVYRGTNETTGRPAAVKVISGEIARQ